MCLGEGGVLQHDLGLCLAESSVLLLELSGLALQHRTELLNLLGLLFHRGSVGVALLLCTVHVILPHFEVHLHLIQLLAETTDRQAQLFVLQARLL
jgi:hypothetical protein